MTEQRFWSKVNKTDTCWLWTAGCSGNGYGVFTIKSKNVSAHRYSYELHYGEILEGLVVRHTCDVRNCVNPNHLLTGTQQDNITDMIEKGRRQSSIGIKNNSAKLSEDDVIEIRIFREFGFTQKQLGEMYGVIRETIKDIISRKNWSHI
jgi:hypothetical protein